MVVQGTDHDLNTVSGAAESFEKLKTGEYRFNPIAVEATVKWIQKLEAFRKDAAGRN